jgi:1-acyl-sn-glycerol-3-phosphate acyltransferase
MATLIKVFAFILKPIYRLLYGLKVEGAGNIPKEGPCVVCFPEMGYMANGMLVVAVAGAREDFTAYVHAGWLSRPWTARIFRWMGTLPAYGERGRSFESLRLGLEALRQGKAVFLAADGELTWDGRPNLPRPGSAWLALRSGAPLVTVVAVGAYDIWPRWSIRPKLTGKCTVRVSEPLYLSDGPCNRVSPEMVQQGSQRILDEAAALIAQGV